MSDSEAETTTKETIRMYNDHLELSHVFLHLNYQDQINISLETTRHIRVLILFELILKSMFFVLFIFSI